MRRPEITSLYKYRPINQFTLDIIANNRIFYPKPEKFNDPFDTQCTFRNTKVFTQSTNLIQIQKAFPNQNPNNIAAFTKQDMTERIAMFKCKLANKGILSLAEANDNILMWSHYGADHSGLCIEFERSSVNALGNDAGCRKVLYTQGYPLLNSKILLNPSSKESNYERVLFTKSVQWEYEQEWRHVMDEGNRAYSNPGKVLSITFGAKASTMDMDIVKKLVEKDNVPLFKAELKAREYALKISKLR